MSLQTNKIYEFGDFRLDLSEKSLHNGGKAISITPKVFETLCVFVENAGRLIEKDELMQKVWQGRIVEESNLTFNIKMLRKALGDNAQKPQFVETVQSRGYRFIAKISEPGPGATGFLQPVEKNAVAAASPNSENQIVVIPKRPARIILFSVGFAAAVFLAFMLSFNFQPNSPANGNQVKSIAVLPLKSLNADNRDSSYELGIADSLIFKIGSAKGIIVRPLSATSQYADIGQDAIAAGREQKVDYVLASNYQIANDKIRITSQLINVQSGLVEGSFKVEQENSTIFSVQDAVAANIGGPLLKKLNRESNDLLERRYTTSEEAYRLYLQGAALADRRTYEDVRKGAEYLEQAIRLDPNYALAYARLASVLVSSEAKEEQYPRAKAAIEKALAIDDNLAEAHSFSGEIKSDFEGDFAGAESEHRKAIELDPNSAVTHRMYSLLLTYVGRYDESIAEIKTAIYLEPASTVNHLVFGRSLLFARRYDEAITELERTAEMDPVQYFAHQSLCVAYRLKGDDDRAFESFIKKIVLEGDESDEINGWKSIYSRAGWHGILERQLGQAKAEEKKGRRNYNLLANLSSELGRRDEAFAYLDKVLEKHATITLLKVHPRFDLIRDDPRFDELVARAGLK